MSDRWTAQTEELGTAALWRHGHLGEELDNAIRSDQPAAVAFTKGAVRAVLAALADAGLLPPPGGETRQEQRHLDSARCEGPCHGPDLGCTHPSHHEHRTVHTGPWVAVSKT